MIKTSHELTIVWMVSDMDIKLEDDRLTPKVGNAVHAHHGSESESHGRVDQCGNPEKHTNIGQDDLLALMRGEDD